MDILLVNETNNSPIETLKYAHLPLWAGVVKGLTPQEHPIDFIDCAFEPLSAKKLESYDAVCLSAYTPNAYNVYKIAQACKEVGVKSIIGGPHASVMPEEAARHCDSVVIGEVEPIWSNILKDLQNKDLKPLYQSEYEWDELPYLDRSIFRKYKYTFDTTEVMRGCPYDCEFCTTAFFYQKRYKYKPIPTLKRELEEVELKNVILIGPNTPTKRKEAIKIFDAVGPYNLRWGFYSSGNLLLDKEDILDSLHRNDCRVVNIGFENLSLDALRSMRKAHNIGIDYERLVRQLHDRNIMVAAALMVGWDTDDKRIFNQVIETVNHFELDFPFVFILTPYPTTNVYYTLDKEKRILTKDWSRYTGTDVVFKPKNMNAEELLRGYAECLERLSSISAELRYALRRRGLKRKIEGVAIAYYHRRLAKDVMKEVERSLEGQTLALNS